MSRNALIVQPDLGTRLLLESIAEADGWQCRQSETFDDAIQDAAWADVVLLDLTLGCPSGIATVPLLRMLAPEARVVVVTGVDHDRAGAIEAGVDAFVTMPFEVSQLVDAMRDDVVIDLRDRSGSEERPWYASAV